MIQLLMNLLYLDTLDTLLSLQFELCVLKVSYFIWRSKSVDYKLDLGEILRVTSFILLLQRRFIGKK